MWIVQIALRRPYTFIVLALLILVISPLVILRTPTDIFPNIDIPVVSILWQYTGLNAEETEQRITSVSERILTTVVNDIEHIESQTMEGVAIIKVFFHPGVRLDTAFAQVSSSTQPVVRLMPPGITPPLSISYNASSVPILQLSLSGNGLTEQQLNDFGMYFIRTQLATVPGAAVPWPYGGKQRQVMIDLQVPELQAKGLSPVDVVTAVNSQNLILPGGTSKIGPFEYDVDLNGSPKTVDELNDLPIRAMGQTTIYVRDVAHVRDGFSPQTNIVRRDGQRGSLLTVMKVGSVSTLDIVERVRKMLPRIASALPPALRIDPLADQSVFVRNAVDSVIREAVIAACLTAIMILLFLGSWRSTVIIAVSIPLSILTSICCLSALGETINIMTLGGLALAVGILVDDATVTIENIERNFEQGKDLHTGILDGAAQIALPALVSTLCISIVFLPMFFLTGVARFLFIPLAEAVVFAMLASYVLSRTLVPTMAMYLLREHGHRGAPAAWNLAGRFQRGFEAGFTAVRERYRRALAGCVRHRLMFAAAFLLVCASAGLLFPWLGQDFFPVSDSGQLKLHLRAKTGTRIEETVRLCDLVEADLRRVIPPEELGSIIDNIGLPYSTINLSYSTSAPIGSMDADILVSLKPDHRPTADYMRELRRRLPLRFPGVAFYFLPADIITQILNFGLPAPIDVQVVGLDVNANRAVRRQPAHAVEARAGGHRSAHPAGFRPAQDSPVRGPHQGRRERLHTGRRGQQHADFAERQFPDHAHLLAGPAQRGGLQRGHADAAVPCRLRSSNSRTSPFREGRRRPSRRFWATWLRRPAAPAWPWFPITTCSALSISTARCRTAIWAGWRGTSTGLWRRIAKACRAERSSRCGDRSRPCRALSRDSWAGCCWRWCWCTC